jgi:hypothetical protein
MLTDFTDRTPLEQPLAALERELIRAYVAGAGQDFETLRARDDEESHQLLAAAFRYVSTKLSEVEARSHYLRELHGQE